MLREVTDSSILYISMCDEEKPHSNENNDAGNCKI